MPEKTETPDTNNAPPSGAGAEAPEEANAGGTQTPPKTEGQSPAELVKSALQDVLAPLQGRLTKLEQRYKGRGIRERLPKPKPQFSFEESEEPEEPSKEELALANEREMTRVEKGVTRIIRDAKYQKLLEQDPTLAEVLDANPLALLKETPIDADDALEQIATLLDEKTAKISQLPTEPKPGEIIPKIVPQAVPTNPSQETPVPPAPETLKKLKTPDEVGKDLAGKITADERLGRNR